MAAPRKTNDGALAVILMLAVFWFAAFAAVFFCLPANAAAPDLKPGDLATYVPVGADRWCVTVHAVDTAQAGPSVWATHNDDPRRLLHVPAAQLTKGCKA